jgi:ubiquinone/menaquinone biosynthesis C-methylase UbiE
MSTKADSEREFQQYWVETFVSDKNKVLEYWNKFRRFDMIKETCSFNQNTKVLDVGCGISTILHFVDGYRFGLDSLAEVYKTLYYYPEDLNIITAVAEDIPFKDNYFDVVFCSNAFDHFDDIHKASDEIYRVLKSGGVFVLIIEIFKEKVERIDAHPYCLLKEEVLDLTKVYTCLYEEVLPWYGLREFAECRELWDGEEILLLLKKGQRK